MSKIIEFPAIQNRHHKKGSPRQKQSRLVVESCPSCKRDNLELHTLFASAGGTPWFGLRLCRDCWSVRFGVDLDDPIPLSDRPW
jgi:hypothetical protein